MAEMVKNLTVKVTPHLTVDRETADVCVSLVNWFLANDDTYRLEVGDDGKWHLTDEPLVPAIGGVIVRPLDNMTFTDQEKEILADMPALKNLARMAGLETE